MLYFMLNSLISCMAVAEEWVHLDGTERKSLRVSHPVGQQRSTYMLSLPMRFGIPLMILITILHWLLSQSVFPIRTAFVDWDGTNDHTRDGTVVGYSVLGIALTLACSLTILFSVLATGFFRRYQSSIPMASTSSLAIAAACHRPREDYDAHLLPLRWGVVSWEGSIGHCAFSTEADDMRPNKGIPECYKAYA